MMALLLLAGAASAHRMFVGQQMTLDLFVFFDDGSPASNAEVKIYSDGKLFADNATDDTGRFTIVLPGKGSGLWRYEVYGGGHEEMGWISINNTPLQATAIGFSLVGPRPMIRRKRQSN